LAQKESSETEPGPLAAGEDRDRFFDMCAAEEQRAGHFKNLLILLAEGGLLVKVAEHGLIVGQAGVDVLGVDADLAAVAPANVAGERIERIDDGPQERRLALAVVADHRGPGAVLDFEIDVGRDLSI